MTFLPLLVYGSMTTDLLSFPHPERVGTLGNVCGLYPVFWPDPTGSQAPGCWVSKCGMALLGLSSGDAKASRQDPAVVFIHGPGGRN